MKTKYLFLTLLLAAFGFNTVIFSAAAPAEEELEDYGRNTFKQSLMQHGVSEATAEKISQKFLTLFNYKPSTNDIVRHFNSYVINPATLRTIKNIYEQALQEAHQGLNYRQFPELDLTITLLYAAIMEKIRAKVNDIINDMHKDKPAAHYR